MPLPNVTIRASGSTRVAITNPGTSRVWRAPNHVLPPKRLRARVGLDLFANGSHGNHSFLLRRGFEGPGQVNRAKGSEKNPATSLSRRPTFPLPLTPNAGFRQLSPKSAAESLPHARGVPSERNHGYAASLQTSDFGDDWQRTDEPERDYRSPTDEPSPHRHGGGRRRTSLRRPAPAEKVTGESLLGSVRAIRTTVPYVYPACLHYAKVARRPPDRELPVVSSGPVRALIVARLRAEQALAKSSVLSQAHRQAASAPLLAPPPAAFPASGAPRGSDRSVTTPSTHCDFGRGRNRAGLRALPRQLEDHFDVARQTIWRQS